MHAHRRRHYSAAQELSGGGRFGRSHRPTCLAEATCQRSGTRSLRGNGPRERGRTAAGRMCPNGHLPILNQDAGESWQSFSREGIWFLKSWVRNSFFSMVQPDGYFEVLLTQMSFKNQLKQSIHFHRANSSEHSGTLRGTHWHLSR